MNSAIWFRFAEAAALILATLAALGLTGGPRRALARRAPVARGRAAKWLWAALESLPFPLLALGLGALALRWPAWTGAA